MGYYERNLPHWHPPDTQLFLTWRLAGSLPSKCDWMSPSRNYKEGHKFAIMDRELERCAYGPVWLQEERTNFFAERAALFGKMNLTITGFATIRSYRKSSGISNRTQYGPDWRAAPGLGLGPARRRQAKAPVPLERAIVDCNAIPRIGS